MDSKEPSDYLHEIEGEIVLANAAGAPIVTVGTFRVYVVDVDGALVERVSAFDVFDTTAETCCFYEPLYAEPYLFKDRVLTVTGMKDEFVSPGLLIFRAPHQEGWHGRPVQLARLLKPGTSDELLPSMIEARVIGIRRSLLLSGLEQVTTGRKSVERYRQTWLCAHERIAPLEWAARPPSSRGHSYSGFDAADNDIAF